MACMRNDAINLSSQNETKQEEGVSLCFIGNMESAHFPRPGAHAIIEDRLDSFLEQQEPN